MADKPRRDQPLQVKLGRWIAALFMIGATHFAIGCVLFLGKTSHEFLLDTVFFIGSLFFTSAAFLQLHKEANVVSRNTHSRRFWKPERIGYWVALSQFVGTLLFNANTFDAFFDLNWIGSELLVWTPNILGSVLFQLSGSLAIFGFCKRWWCWQIHNVDWWGNVINFSGCVAFLISAVLAYVPPFPDANSYATEATYFTLIGACCFFGSALLGWFSDTKLQSNPNQHA